MLPAFVLLTIAADLASDAARMTDPVAIVKLLGTNDRKMRELARNYTFLQREEEKELDPSGKLKKTETTTSEYVFLYGRPYERRVAKNDQPLSPKEEAKEEEKFQKESAKRSRESDADRAKLAKKEDEERQRIRKLIDELDQAFHLTLDGVEQVDGRAVYRIAAEPRADYKRKLPPFSVLKRLRGTMWIDAEEFQLVKVDAEVIEPISFGLFLASVAAGSKMHFEQTRVNGELWLPKQAWVKAGARVAWKRINGEQTVTWSNYRRFSADSRLVSTEDPPQ